jgi:hypothetical protein
MRFYIVAQTQLSLAAAGSAVLFGRKDAELFHSTIKGGFVDAQFPCRAQPAEGVSFEGGADGLGIENFMGIAHIGVRTGPMAMGGQLAGQMRD